MRNFMRKHGDLITQLNILLAAVLLFLSIRDNSLFNSIFSTALLTWGIAMYFYQKRVEKLFETLDMGFELNKKLIEDNMRLVEALKEYEN